MFFFFFFLKFPAADEIDCILRIGRIWDILSRRDGSDWVIRRFWLHGRLLEFAFNALMFTPPPPPHPHLPRGVGLAAGARKVLKKHVPGFLNMPNCQKGVKMNNTVSRMNMFDLISIVVLTCSADLHQIACIWKIARAWDILSRRDGSDWAIRRFWFRGRLLELAFNAVICTPAPPTCREVSGLPQALEKFWKNTFLESWTCTNAEKCQNKSKCVFLLLFTRVNVRKYDYSSEWITLGRSIDVFWSYLLG